MDYHSEEAARLRRVLALAEAGLLIRREYYRRQNPAATESDLTVLVNRWMREQHAHEWAGPFFRERALPVS